MPPRLTGLCLALLLTLTTNVYAEQKTGLYVGAQVGGTTQSDTTLASPTLANETVELKTGYTFGGMLGYDFGQGLRVEGEMTYHENGLRTDGGGDPQVVISVMMLNAFYDFHPLQNVKDFAIYGGGGFGVATVQLETNTLSQWINEGDNVFAYQFETGIGYSVTPEATFTLGYRYLDGGDPEFLLDSGDRVTMGWTSHEMVLKLRYRFPL